MKYFLFLSIISLAILNFSCSTKENKEMKSQDNLELSNISNSTIEKVINTLSQKYPNIDKDKITRGVSQTASLWRAVDGTEMEFIKFCNDNFISDDAKLDEMFSAIQKNMESIAGNMNQINLDLKEKIHLDEGEISNLDMLFGSYDPASHISDDFFLNKIAFIIKLNFPHYSLAEKQKLGENWARKQWAFARIGDAFLSRVPASVVQDEANALAAADNYISNYNIYAGYLVDDNMQTYFPQDMKLITHWNLRDEIKSQYSNADGLKKQKMLYEVMKRIITQTIPEEVINNNTYQWNPYKNVIYKNGKEVKFTSEPNTRYQTFLNNFLAEREIDKYNPMFPTAMDRTFEESLEIPEKDVENLFVELLSSPIAKQVGELIAKRLGRPLEAFDIWYDGFKSRSTISPAELDVMTKKKYPTTQAFEKDIPNIYAKLGFTKDKAQFIASKIQVDPARGAGHAWGSEMHSQKSHLRTRVGKDGMDYKGYNIAVHELGHNTEQTITLHDVDYYALKGVPNTAFTETWAFIFQSRDLDLLGLKSKDINEDNLKILDSFWSMYEIMGVSLVDMKVWDWLYKNPNASAEQLKNEVIDVSKQVWNQYYAPVFGMKDEIILGIYSHMIDYPLYLPAYPIGHIVEFQIENYVKGKNIATEMERMLSQGKIVPQIWMKNAVGTTLSVKPILESVKVALQKVQ
jgi:hypothetical protein